MIATEKTIVYKTKDLNLVPKEIEKEQSLGWIWVENNNHQLSDLTFEVSIKYYKEPEIVLVS